jgi:hypothetical protein
MKETDQELWVVYESGQGTEGPGKGKHLVFVSGDEEYRSEEALPMLAKILAVRHGFKCTVLFAIDPETGSIDPGNQTNIPGLHQLETADLMVLFLRFRELPDDQMKYIVDYTNSGRPIIGLRTATHAFNYTRNKNSPYAKYSFNYKGEDFESGYGRQVFGETWVSHHGHHGKESTRGVINEELKAHPILKGVKDIWGPTDVYTVRELTGDAKVLVFGQTLAGMEPTATPNPDKSMMPLAWVKSYAAKPGKTSRVFCTTMGASVDLQSEGLRRLLVNACYWGLGMENQIQEKSRLDYVGEYRPTFFGFGTHKKGVRPSDLKL